MGTLFAISAYACSSPATTSRATGVSIRPGLTAFTRMPCFIYSRAAVRVRPITPCFEAMYEPIPGLPVSAPTEALLTIAPLPWRSICRSSCFMQLHTPRRLIPMTRSHSARVAPEAALPARGGAMGGGRAPGHVPGVVERGPEPAELGNGAVDHRRNL